MLQARILRFGPFVLDVRTGELRKHGTRIRLQDQSFQILLMLLDQPGEVVLREDIRLRLWPNDTIVEFDHSINAAVKRLRNSLGESAEAPRYIETLAKRGYRFLGTVSEDGREHLSETEPESSPTRVDNGTVASRYRIVDKLGEGGMGVVYRADDLRLGRAVALKFLPLSETESAQAALQRFELEARAASALNHPNICTIYGLEDVEGRPAIVMELMEGETLSARLAKGTPPLPEALKMAIQIAAALAAAHRKGVVHCDLKPGNIMLTKAGVKVLDFGLAKIEGGAVAGGESTANAGDILGTAHYMSPEQVQGLNTDFRSDIFSFGVVLYQLLTGKRPFEAESAAGVRTAILETEPAPLGDSFPLALDRVIRRCLVKNVEDRWQSAQDLKAELEWIAAAPPPERLGLGPAGQAAARTSRITASARWLWAATFALGALLGSGIVWLARAPSAPIENPLANAQFTRLTDFDGVKYDAALSPDGKLVAFRADRDGPSDVWLTEVGSGQFINLTHGLDNGTRNQLRSLGFSGDGSEIWLSGRVGNRLRLMPLMGGQPRSFLRDHVVNVAWSPDGAHIVYHTNEEGDPTFVADRNGENPRQIFIHPIRPGGHAHFPTWSPDGRWIYVAAGIASALQMDLWRIPSAGGKAERLTHHNSDVEYPTPIDRRTVLYIAPDQDDSGPWLWALDVERKVTRRVSFGLEQFESIAASADGRRLVATVANPSASLWSVPILDRPAEERDVKQLPLPAVNASAPRFGPGSLFYLSPRGAGNALWRYQNERAMEIWNASDGAQLWPPGVSSDGRHVAIAVPRNGKRLLHVLSSDGAELQSLAPAIDVQGSSGWSPDGRWIAVGGNDERGPGLFKVPVDGGAPTRLVAGTAINPVWSGDGSLIVYAGAGAAAYSPLLAVRPDGSPVQLPAIQIRRGDGERARFLPSGKGLVYMQGLLPSQDFWLLDLTTKKTRQLTRLENRAAMLSFDITPDGKEILFDRLNDNSEVVLIDLPDRGK